VSEHDTASSIFAVHTRNGNAGPYADRSVNMAFENKHLPLFKIVPPTVGSFIYLESRFRIDAIAYHKGKIHFYLTLDFSIDF